MSKELTKVWKEIAKLSKMQLLKLLNDYNKYVIEITDREDGSVPVCLPEYYQNDWRNK